MDFVRFFIGIINIEIIMKRTFLILTALFLFWNISLTATAQEAELSVEQKIESKDYTILVTLANPMKGKSIYLSYGYDLQVRNDSAIAYLPYFGTAHSAPVDPSEGGIKFSEPMENYSSVQNKKGDRWEIAFDVKKGIELFKIRISVFENGSVTLSINPSNRSHISFNGDLK